MMMLQHQLVLQQAESAKEASRLANTVEAAEAEVGALREQTRVRKEYMICPRLLDCVSTRIATDASVMKQVRKAREERALLPVKP